MTLFTDLPPAAASRLLAALGWPPAAPLLPLADAAGHAARWLAADVADRGSARETSGGEHPSCVLLVAANTVPALSGALDAVTPPMEAMMRAGDLALVLANAGPPLQRDAAALTAFTEALRARALPPGAITLATSNLAVIHQVDAAAEGEAPPCRLVLLGPIPGEAEPPVSTDRPDLRFSLAGAINTAHGVILGATLLQGGLLAGRDYGTGSAFDVSASLINRIERYKATPANKLSERVAAFAAAMPPAADDRAARATAPAGHLAVIADEAATYGSVIRIPPLVRSAIAQRLPFVVLGGPHALRLVRALGFETFGPVLDEAYDDVMEPNLRLDILAQELLRLAEMDAKDFAAVIASLDETLTRNAARLAALDEAKHAPPADAGPPHPLPPTPARVGRANAPAQDDGTTPAAAATSVDQGHAASAALGHAASGSDGLAAASLALSRRLRHEAVHSRFSVPARLVPDYRRTSPLPQPLPLVRPAARGERPVIGIVSHLASSGGTAISKCIGTMGGVTLLSEIHPHASVALGAFNPLYQYQRWFGLSDALKTDLRHIAESGTAEVVDIIDALARDAGRRGTRLVLRDWAYVDYLGGGGLPPSYRPSLVDLLAPRFETTLLITTRHPLDVWLSMLSSRFAKPEMLAPVMKGFARFAEYAAANGFMTYEAFTEAPEAWLRAATTTLGVPFDPEWSATWADYRKITGDSGRRSADIAPRPRRPVSDEMMHSLTTNPDYRRTCALLGYD
ncbi:hypothetical protein [Acuticoccus yangtzensis]|uniref:hypothetical protein n=1 Tax=Acuticoccus yangtzensis TaxID=1443441 RepID=UPI000A7DF0F2|nr:hypothetical protein [Acuticoccus yangtzensis]